MKKAAIILTALMLISLFAVSCQKAKGQEGNKEAQAQKEEDKSQPSKGPVNVESKNVGKTILTKNPKIRQKELYDLSAIEKLSEKESQSRWDGLREKFKDGKATDVEKNELLKMAYSSIKNNPGQNGEELLGLQNTMNVIINEFLEDKVLRTQVIDVLLDILQYHQSPAARAHAAEAFSNKKSLIAKQKEIINALKESIVDSDFQVRIPSAYALLAWGEGDIALPVLDEGAKAGDTWALDYLFKNDGSLWDKRGKDILIRALNYPSDEVKVFAAAELAKRGWEKKKAEKVALMTLEKLAMVSKWSSSERRTCDRALLVLRSTKSKDEKILSLLKKIAQRPDISYLDKHVYETIELLEKGRE